MTQIIFNIKDSSLIPILEGIGKRLKGVSISIKTPRNLNESISKDKYEKRTKAIEELNKTKFDQSLIDLNDDRTLYLMSK